MELSKLHQTLLYKLFSVEGQTETGTNIMNRISQFRYPIKNALHIYRRPAKFLAFLQTVEQISHYCRSVQHNYTSGPLADTNNLISLKLISNSLIKSINSKFHLGIISWHFLLRHYTCLPDTSNLSQVQERTVICWVQCA